MKKPLFSSVFAGLIILTLVGCGTPASSPQGNVSKSNSAVSNSPNTSSFPSTQTKTPSRRSYPVLSSIHMVNQIKGWAMAKSGAVWYTTDGAKTWDNVTPKAIQLLLPFPISFYYFGANNVWLLMSPSNQKVITFFKTSNHGKTWKVSKMNKVGYRMYLQFTDQNHGWLLISLGAAAGSEQASLYQTGNRGESWRKISYRITANNGSMPLTGDELGVYFINSEHGWLTGFTSASGVVYLYQTRNDGRTWTQQNIPIPSKLDQFITNPPIFFSKKDGIFPVVVASESNINSVKLLVYRTINGGNSWIPTIPVPLSWNSTGVDKWSFISKSTWFVGANKLYITHDGGQKWNSIDTNISIKNVNEVDFVSSQDGWALMKNSDALYHTVDGGQVWEKIHGN